MKEVIDAEGLLEEVKIALKDIFVSTVRKKGSEIEMKFPNGQIFTVTLWEEKRKNA